jgi:PIN domain nuclease of toxin-antitoxin system
MLVRRLRVRYDRLLIAQAQLEDLAVATSDAAFRDYDVEVIAA